MSMLAKELHLSAEEDKAIQEICRANGVTVEQFMHSRQQVERVELFQQDYNRILGIRHFVGLKEVSFLSLPIRKIEGLESCPNLEKLVVAETQVSVIEGIDKCHRLKELYLYSNRIDKIEGLNDLLELEVLWLNDNRIEKIENLRLLKKLRVLWLARNSIETISSEILELSSLEELNLAGNRIGSFKEIPPLSRLPRLRRLSFNDPDHGDNPVCHLCNYLTYVEYHLRQLQSLDTLPVSEDRRHVAVATFMKKRMYYNMRIKTLKRNSTNVLKWAEEVSQNKLNQINSSLNVLIRMQKDIQRELDEEQWYPAGENDEDETQGELEAPVDTSREGIGEFLEALKLKLHRVEGCVSSRLSELRAISEYSMNLRRRTFHKCDESISRLLIELETGGNIRLEEGKSTDVWFKSCVDLVKSRFFESDFMEFGIEDIRIHRVVRLHNRYMRNRFEDRLDAVTDVGDQSYKKHMEYLFCGEYPQLFLPGSELTRVVEEGFRPAQWYEDRGLDGAIVLSNSVSMSDVPRIRSYIKQNCRKVVENQGARKGDSSFADSDDDMMKIPPGRLLIAKVYLGKYAPDSGGASTTTSLISHSVHRPMRIDPYSGREVPLISAEYFPGNQAVYRLRSGDSKQRQWFVFDSHLVVPEYIIEFGYVYSSSVGTPSTTASPMFPSRNTSQAPDPAVPNVVDDATNDVPLLRHHEDVVMEKLLTTIPINSESDQTDIRVMVPTVAHYLPSGKLPDLTVGGPVATQSEVLNMPPTIPQRTRISVITQEELRKACHLRELAEIQYLNLTGNHIRRMECLHLVPNLKVLCLSFNELQTIEGLEALRSLERLELGFNLIKRIERLRGLSSLRHLELNNNLIYRLEDLNVLKKYVPELTYLNLRSNAICDVRSYRYTVLRRMTKLKFLDDIPVTEDERQESIIRSSTVSTDLVLARYRYQQQLLDKQLRDPTSTSSLAGFHHMLYKAPNATDIESKPPLPTTVTYPNPEIEFPSSVELVAPVIASAHSQLSDEEVNRQLLSITDLDLRHLNLRRITVLDRLRNLVRLNLCDNEMSRIEGIERLVHLEELNLEENRILKIEGLSNLTRLRKLHLGKNKIYRIEGLQQLVHLTQLSIEDNELQSLQGLQTLNSLMELYASNNKIDSPKDVNILRDLPKLIIADFSGNNMCREEEYRLHVVYQLRKLKVLDGVSIDASEAKLARESFAGKLTQDILVERIGHNDFLSITNLNLSNAGIREIACLDEFYNLEELNLDNNRVLDFSGLRKLGSLLVLRLNGNSIETTPAAANRKTSFCNCIEGLVSLQVLQLGQNNISSIAALNLGQLPQLKVLFLHENEIQRVEGLENLYDLRELVLDKNRIRSIDERSFQSLSHLRVLRMEENILRNLDHFRPLQKLQSLHLGVNRIMEISELDKLSGLSNVLEIIMAYNPVSRKPMYRSHLIHVLPNVQIIDSKEVTTEERERCEMFFARDVHPANVVLAAAQVSTDPRTAAHMNSGSKVAVKLTSVNFDYGSPSMMQMNMGGGNRGRGSGSGLAEPVNMLGNTFSTRNNSGGINGSDSGRMGTPSGGHSQLGRQRSTSSTGSNRPPRSHSLPRSNVGNDPQSTFHSAAAGGRTSSSSIGRTRSSSRSKRFPSPRY